MTPWPLPRGRVTSQDIHEALWRLAGPRRRIKVNSFEMSVELGLTPVRVKQYMSRLVAEGRIRKVGSGRYWVPTYLVSDPDQFAVHGPAGRTASWG